MAIQSKRDIVGTQKLAEILDLTDRRIQQLVTEGVLDKVGRGKYDLVKSVQSYIAYQINTLKARQSTGSKLDEETRLLKERADQVAMENDKLRGELIPVDAVKLVWQHLVTAARSRLLAIPSKVKTSHSDMDISIVNAIEREVRECMEDMSHDGLPERYRKPVENVELSKENEIQQKSKKLKLKTSLSPLGASTGKRISRKTPPDQSFEG